jgi:hypothetical protein
VNLLHDIKNFNADAVNLDDAVATLAVGKAIIAEWSAQGIPAPDWLSEKVGEIGREVKARHRDFLERALREAMARKAALKTREQKAADADGEIERLKALLQP